MVETAHYLGIGISNLVVAFSPRPSWLAADYARMVMIEEALTETWSELFGAGCHRHE